MLKPSSSEIDLPKNRILAALSKEEFERLLSNLQFVSLDSGQVLWSIGDLTRYAFFPQDSTISLLASMGGGRTAEVTLVGEEGMLGLQGLLGAKRSENFAVVQIPGSCFRIKTIALQTEFKRGGKLQERLLHYTCYLLAQISQTAACNRAHLVGQRLAHWLLMVHDRANRDQFPMLRTSLSDMLGTPRSEVNLAIGILRKAGFIGYSRGRITILDRKGLESAACICYRIIAKELHYLLP